ncbi:MAG: toxin-antitoxin system YwqK family antitoxin [Bacteroidota bacterium]
MRFFIFTFLCCYALSGISQTVDANGKKQGYWKKKDEKTNHLLYEGAFKDDKPIGKFKYYYPHDTVRAILVFRPDGKTIGAKLFHFNGKRMAQGNYIKKEIKDSTWSYFDEEGVLISVEKYKAGKKEGTSCVYLPDGKISEEFIFKNGLENGPFIKYFDGVTIRAKGQYLNGRMEGKVIHYFPNGVEAAAGYYLNGNKNGVWLYKNQDGSIKEKELYKNGQLASKKEMEVFFKKNKTETPQQTKPNAVSTGTLYNNNPKPKMKHE